MKLFFALVAVMLTFAGCAKKEWNKQYIVNNCLREFNKRNEKEKIFSGMQIPLLCDCVADKLLANYKSERESDKDESGTSRIGSECAQQVLMK